MNKFAKAYRKKADEIMNDKSLSDKEKMDGLLAEAIAQTKAKVEAERDACL